MIYLPTQISLRAIANCPTPLGLFKMDLNLILTTDRDPVPRRVPVSSMLTTDLAPVLNGVNMGSVLPTNPECKRMDVDSMLTTELDPVGSVHIVSTLHNTLPSLSQVLYIPIPAPVPAHLMDSFNAAIDEALRTHDRKARRRSAIEHFMKSATTPVTP